MFEFEQEKKREREENGQQVKERKKEREATRERETHVFMFHVFEKPHLPVGAFGVDDGLKWPREFLHGNTQASVLIKRRTARHTHVHQAVTIVITRLTHANNNMQMYPVILTGMARY